MKFSVKQAKIFHRMAGGKGAEAKKYSLNIRLTEIVGDK